MALPHGEVNFVEPDRVIGHLAVAVLLIIDGDRVPACLARRTIDVKSVSNAIQRDGLEQQVAAGSPLDLNDQMIPSIVFRVARNTSSDPLLVDIVVGVPFVAAGNAALVTPDVALAAGGAHELIDVELKGLGIRHAVRIEVNVIDEVMSVIGQGMFVIWKALTRKRAHEMIIPEDVGICMSAANLVFGSATAYRRRRDTLCSVPIHAACRGRAGTADTPAWSKQGVTGSPGIFLQIRKLVVIGASGLSICSGTYGRRQQTKNQLVPSHL